MALDDLGRTKESPNYMCAPGIAQGNQTDKTISSKHLQRKGEPSTPAGAFILCKMAGMVLACEKVPSCCAKCLVSFNLGTTSEKKEKEKKDDDGTVLLCFKHIMISIRTCLFCPRI